MSMILLAVEDVDRDARIRDLLTGEGWWVTTVASKEEALRAAADHAPQLLILDRGMDDPSSLLKVFSRDGGGCGVLVLLDSVSEEAAGDFGDGVVARDQAPEDLVAKVRGSLEAPRPAQEASPLEDPAAGGEQQLTARELFGDILVDLGETGALEEAVDDESGHPAGAEPADAEPAEAQPTDAEPAERESGDQEPWDEKPEEQGPEEQEPEEQELEVHEPEEQESKEEELEEDGPVEVPIPPDVAAADASEAAVQAVPGPEGEPSSLEAALERPEGDAESEQESEREEVAEDEAGAGLETRPEVSLLTPLVTELDPDEGESTTDLAAEVANLLETSRDDWPLSGDLGSGEGLSFEEVLAVEESVPESEPAEAEAMAGDDRDGEAPAELEPAEPGEDFERVGPYELLELAEFGDLTERWLARRIGGGVERVILERVRPELRSRADVRDAFVEGNSDAAGWEHENVLGVVDLGREGDVDYVATAYYPGRSLAEVLDRVARMEARMPLGVSLLLIERIAAALEVLAESPATSRHGWLVPSSIWLGQGGEVLVREFGLGRLAASEDTLVRDWTEHRFSAPEKWSDRGDVRSDLYSLGAVLYEMVSGQPIHKAEDYKTLVEKIRSADITPAQSVDPTIPTEIDAWVMRLLRRNAQDRPQSVPEVMAKIDLALQALPARPASAELNAYVRQLFAARVPDLPVPVAAAVPAEAAPEAASSDEIQEVAAGRRWQWWWLLLPLLMLLSMFVGWKLLSSGGDAAGLSNRPGPSPEVVAAAPRSADPQHALFK